MTTLVICPTCGKPGFERPIRCGRSHIDPLTGDPVFCDAPAHHDGAHWAWTRDHAKTAWRDAMVEQETAVLPPERHSTGLNPPQHPKTPETPQ